MAKKFSPNKDEYCQRGEFTLKVLEVHRGGEVTIRNQFGFAERVKVTTLSAPDPGKVAQIKRRIELGARPGAKNF